MFHKYSFAVDQVGNATWKRDGAVQLSRGGFPTNIRMFIAFNASSLPGVPVRFDNAVVTSP
jgi:hypothetical protein